MEALIGAALDQTSDFEVVDKPLAEAFLLVAEQTGIAISIAPGTLALLPEGAGTRMTARMRNVPLREGMDQLLEPLGLRYRIAGDGLRVEAGHALRRIGRRATWDELEAVRWLGEELQPSDAEQLDKLRRALEFKVGSSPDSQRAFTMLIEAMPKVGGETIAESLDAACGGLAWAWYPSSEKIVVLPATEHMKRVLRLAVTLTANHRALSEVLLDLAAQTGVTLRFDPDAIGSLPRETQRDFTVRLANVPLEQALEVISGTTGLAFKIETDAVRFFNPRQATVTERVAAVLVIPGRGEIPLYERDLPEDVRESLRALIERLAKAIPPPGDSETSGDD